MQKIKILCPCWVLAMAVRCEKEEEKEEKNTKISGHYVRLQLNRLHSDRSDQLVYDLILC